MKKILICASIATLAIGLSSCGKRLPKTYNVNKHAIPYTAKDLTDTDREQRILLAAEKHGWSCSRADKNKLTCNLRARGHTATIDIDHKSDNFSISYVDSSNLKHTNGKIHPTYNRWIKKLEQTISREITPLKAKYKTS